MCKFRSTYPIYFDMADHPVNNLVCKNGAAAYSHSLPVVDDWLHIGTPECQLQKILLVKVCLYSTASAW